MKIITEPITNGELSKLAKQRFGNMVKAVVDVERGIMALDGELHADEEAWLLEQGSKQEHLWGINLYPELEGVDFIEFDALINLRPSAKNVTRGVDSSKVKERIVEIVNRLIQR